jgi:endonuclease/exonuclease/phosphatase family metal-dependent hydrolase
MITVQLLCIVSNFVQKHASLSLSIQYIYIYIYEMSNNNETLCKTFTAVELSEAIPERLQASDVRIVQYNVNLWKSFDKEYNFAAVVAWLKTTRADIVCFNECLFTSTSQITRARFIHTMKSELGYHFITMCDDYYGINVVCSKFPFHACQVVDLGKDPIKKQTRYCIHIEFSSKKLNKVHLFVTHLDAFDNTENTRYAQMKKILTFMNEKPSLLLGDLNSLNRPDYSESEWKAIIKSDEERKVETQTWVTELLAEQGYVDHVQKPNTVSCWTNRRVDYCLTRAADSDKTFQVVQCQFIKCLASDHFPLITDIRME